MGLSNRVFSLEILIIVSWKLNRLIGFSISFPQRVTVISLRHFCPDRFERDVCLAVPNRLYGRAYWNLSPKVYLKLARFLLFRFKSRKFANIPLLTVIQPSSVSLESAPTPPDLISLMIQQQSRRKKLKKLLFQGII